MGSKPLSENLLKMAQQYAVLRADNISSPEILMLHDQMMRRFGAEDTKLAVKQMADVHSMLTGDKPVEYTRINWYAAHALLDYRTSVSLLKDVT